MMIISKQNFPDHVVFSLNVKDDLVNPAIKDAQRYDLLPKLGALVPAITSLVNPQPTVWTGAVSVVGKLYIFNDQVWKAINAVTTDPVAGVDWQLSELGTFWYVHIKPYMVFLSFSRFLLTHGSNVTQFGLTEQYAPDQQQVTDQRRANIIKDTNGKASIEQNLMMKALADAGWKFDGVQYTSPAGAVERVKTKKFGINPIYHDQ